MFKLDACVLKKVKDKHLKFCEECLKNVNEEIAIKKGAVSERVIFKLSRKEIETLCCLNPFASGGYGLRSEVIKIKNKLLKSVKDAQVLQKLFEKYYKKFRSAGSWGGCALVKALNVKTCPYCGMQYMASGDLVTESTLDHFVSKESEPVLALNLYNLIPCCRTCNCTYKGRRAKKVINPYFDNLADNVRFDAKFKNSVSTVNDIIRVITKIDQEDFSIEVKNTCLGGCVKDQVNNHLGDVLKLEERYKKYEGIARSTMKKNLFYNRNYYELLLNSGLEFSHDEIMKMFIYQDMNDENEPFAKFKSDIWNNFENLLK